MWESAAACVNSGSVLQVLTFAEGQHSDKAEVGSAESRGEAVSYSCWRNCLLKECEDNVNLKHA